MQFYSYNINAYKQLEQNYSTNITEHITFNNFILRYKVVSNILNTVYILIKSYVHFLNAKK